MTIELVTGVPGAGKTLYTVSEKLARLVGTTIEYEGRLVERRLKIGNIRDLLLPHEMIEVPEWRPEGTGGQADNGKPWTTIDPYIELVREPGSPPLEGITHSAMNWWAWCQPGDVIVIDECQKLFRPMASGRRVPQFIAMLERHRHFGVDFILVTQHPSLIHTNVRNLIGRYEHLRRAFGGSHCILYEWDHCTLPDKVKTATTTTFRHKKKAFGLYKSAEVHTKVKHRLPWAIWLAVAGLFLLGGVLWHLKTRIHEMQAPSLAAAEAVAKAASAPGASVVARAASSVRAALADIKGAEAAPVFAGCIQMGKRCECIADTGKSVDVELAFCQATTARSGVGIPYEVAHGRTTEAQPVKPQAAPKSVGTSRPADALASVRSSEPAYSVSEPADPAHLADLELARFVHRQR